MDIKKFARAAARKAAINTYRAIIKLNSEKTASISSLLMGNGPVGNHVSPGIVIELSNVYVGQGYEGSVEIAGDFTLHLNNFLGKSKKISDEFTFDYYGTPLSITWDHVKERIGEQVLFKVLDSSEIDPKEKDVLSKFFSQNEPVIRGLSSEIFTKIVTTLRTSYDSYQSEQDSYESEDW